MLLLTATVRGPQIMNSISRNLAVDFLVHLLGTLTDRRNEMSFVYTRLDEFNVLQSLETVHVKCSWSILPCHAVARTSNHMLLLRSLNICELCFKFLQELSECYVLKLFLNLVIVDQSRAEIVYFILSYFIFEVKTSSRVWQGKNLWIGVVMMLLCAHKLE